MGKISLFLIMILVSSCGLSTMRGQVPPIASEEPKALDGVSDQEMRIFITSETTSANLGGISGADRFCQRLATTAGLKRSYQALLADRNTPATTRFNSDRPIYMVNATGDRLAMSESIGDFVGDLAHYNSGQSIILPIGVLYTEKGQTVVTGALGYYAWTGVERQGQLDVDCQQWTSSSINLRGIVGIFSMTTQHQWFAGMGPTCGTQARLYCLSN